MTDGQKIILDFMRDMAALVVVLVLIASVSVWAVYLAQPAPV